MRSQRLDAAVRLCFFALVCLCTAPGSASAAKKKYFFSFDRVAMNASAPNQDPEVLELTRAELIRATAAHSQLVASLDGCPDLTVGNLRKIRACFTKKRLAGAYTIIVEITALDVTVESRSGSTTDEQRLVVFLAIRMFGETIPERKIGFTGNGRATIKLDIGKKVRANERTYAIEQAVKVAIGDALQTSLAQLSRPSRK